MMFDLLFQCAVKSAVIVAAGIGGIGFVASGSATDEHLFGISVATIRELGSFGLVALFVLGILWSIKAMLPKVLDFLADTKNGFLEELKTTRESNSLEQAAERASREKQIDAFREMMQAHKASMEAQLSALKEVNEHGNSAIRELVAELKGRPCQKKIP